MPTALRSFLSLFAGCLGAVSLFTPCVLASADVPPSVPWLVRLSDFAQRTSDGRFGFLLKPVGQTPTLDLHADEPFEPASAIKTLIHLHAMLLVQRGEVSLEERLVVYTHRSDSCPLDAAPRVSSLRDALRAMMQESDNAATQALRSRFTDEALRATATTLGLSSTLLRHRIGCPDSAYDNPNQTTLLDLALLYEPFASGLLAPETLAITLDLMNTCAGDTLPAPLRAITREEADAAALSPTATNALLARTLITQKSGNYDWQIGPQQYHHRAHAGLLTLPFKLYRGDSTSRSFSFAAFVNDASEERAADTTATTLFWEVLRPTIRQAVQSWAAAEHRRPADLDNGLGSGVPDGEVDLHDLVYYLDLFAAGDPLADLDDGTGTGTPDGAVSIDDLLHFIAEYEQAR